MAAKSKAKIITPMTRWFKTVRALNDLDQIDLAGAIGVSRSAVGMYETGTPVPQEVIDKILSTYPDIPKLPDPKERDKPIEITQTGFAVPKPTFELRYAGLVPTSSEWGDPLESDTPVEVDEKYFHKQRFVCGVTGSSCFPALQQGDVTYWHYDLAPKVGKIVLAQRKSDRACTVKQLAMDPTSGEYFLKPINPKEKAPSAEEGWEAIAYLVYVEWEDEEGGTATLYRDGGIAPEQLIKLRT